MGETIRSALWCTVVCLGIFLTARMLRASGALSFLPENDAGKAAAVLGSAVSQDGWSGELVAVFAAQGD
ncbi:hypothetical protein [Butyricicoccus sp.]|uniref:hypothetical protein n=1 Tax=Butyricicoccus sp. TaxID=2049021 RepID=UPI003735607C